MEEASCEKAAYVSSYQDNIDDFTVLQGPAARIRPRQIPEQFFTCESSLTVWQLDIFFAENNS